jgi:hypothetical protein
MKIQIDTLYDDSLSAGICADYLESSETGIGFYTQFDLEIDINNGAELGCLDSTDLTVSTAYMWFNGESVLVSAENPLYDELNGNSGLLQAIADKANDKYEDTHHERDLERELDYADRLRDFA